MAESRNAPVRHNGGSQEPPTEGLGRSEAYLEFQKQISRVARVNRPVLLVGERGSGKELAAARVHFLSKRWEEPLVSLNCSALSPTLIESELFGHEAGAFTGAAQRRTGRFEAANGGTLFLDEIGNIPVETQEKILRVVEYGGFERVGSSQAIRVDVRIVGATNSDLRDLAAEGRFMRDLLDRLSFEVIFVPPLRERREDIMLLANHFALRMAHELGWSDLPVITEDAARLLEEYPWPGNVRELKNVIERAVYRSDDAIIADTEIVFDPFDSPYRAEPAAREPVAPKPSTGEAKPSGSAVEESLDVTFEQAVQAVELRMLNHALKRARYNQHRASELLGLTYNQFRGLYRKYRDQLQPEQ
ncbi:MAG: phage shock protein operon transcriptional activator [Candidatus Hydrogenedentes bacterium]|nr:phage shock protein operon transcriptional activator [Candidatus Hydrogenedentota bacterium]